MSGQSVQRYYDPAVGRFLSVDTVTASSINGWNFNRYWYANNNPYKFTDPDGRQSMPVQCKECENAAQQAAAAQATLQAGGTLEEAQAAAAPTHSTGGGNPLPASARDGHGIDIGSVLTGDGDLVATGVLAGGAGVKGEKALGEGGDKISFVTPALGASASVTTNVLTISYNFDSGEPSPLDLSVGGGLRGAFGLAGDVGISLSAEKVELRIGVGFGAGGSFDVFGLGWLPGGK